MKPRLIIEQKVTFFTNQYRVFGAGEEGAKASLLSFAQQKRLAFREKVTFYSDEAKSREAFTFRAEKVMDVHGRYFIEDENGNVVGMLRKVFGASLLKSTWMVMDKDGTELFQVSENNVALAVIRRFGGILPIVGGFVELLVMFFRYHFEFIDKATGATVGKYEKTTLFRDHYSLSVEGEAFERVDWRVWAALGVALDALQSR
jgi:uncharacterized protein YxjI